MVVGAVAVDMDIGPVRFAEAVLTVTLLGLTFGGLALAIGCITGNRGLALGVSSAAAVSTFVANALGEIADFIDPAKWVSPFYYYNDANVLANGLNPAHAAVLAAAAAVLIGIGYRAFQRRDLRL
jgi:ABC-2 type transport system permease protein